MLLSHSYVGYNILNLLRTNCYNNKDFSIIVVVVFYSFQQNRNDHSAISTFFVYLTKFRNKEDELVHIIFFSSFAIEIAHGFS